MEKDPYLAPSTQKEINVAMLSFSALILSKKL